MDTQTPETEAASVIPKVGFGDRMRRIRLDAGMNQAEFAEAIGMGKAAYGHHELLADPPRTARLMAYAIELRFHVPAWWTLGEPEPSGDLRVTNRYHAAADWFRFGKLVPFQRAITARSA